MQKTGTSAQPNGLPMAFVTYLIWGLLPLYLRLVHQVPAFEFVGWRVVFTLPVCLILVMVMGQWQALKAALAWPVLRLLMLSAILVGINWMIYILAVQTGHVLATSIGYYMNPLANVLAGTLFLGERLSRRQWLAVGLAALGVGVLAWGALDTLWISVTLAFSFCAYGLVRKLAPVESLAGLSVETMVLLPIAVGIVGWYAASPAGSSIGAGLTSDLLIAFSGVVTAVPLLLFAYAARRMDYSALGMMQFIAPTIVFFLGLFVFNEPLNQSQLICFMLIWSALAVFMWDLWLQRRKRLASEAPA